MYPHFSLQQVLPLYPAILLLIFSVFVFERNKPKTSLLLLFLGTVALGCFIALLDPFLIIWDEQYHALVAKNMVHHPFKPMLYAEPVLGYDYRDWVNNSLWLHKQPLFLWQIALSLKIFGLNAFAVRLPSIIMHAIIPLMIYRIGKISVDGKTGFYAGLFFAVAYFPLELVAARYSTDHNDLAFLFYITASLWSWFEYQKSGKFGWVILVGVFSGAAVLVKWVLGLLVYLPWGITILSDKDKRSSPSYYTHCFGSFLIALVVFLPWQFYILKFYPLEAYYEMSMSSKHLHTVIEGHGGSVWFHFIALRKLYGQGQAVPFLLLAGLIVLFIKVKELKYKIGLFIPLIAVYLFFSIVADKMLAFCIIVAAVVFLGMATLMLSLISYLNKYLKKPSLISSLTILFAISIAFFNLDLWQIQGYHTQWKPNDNWNRKAEMFEMRGIKALKEKCGDDKYVVFNANMRFNGHIPVMFFTNNIAYSFIPSSDQLNTIKSKSYKTAIFNLGNLPDYITNDTTITIINIPDN